ncbi:MAG: UDP-2,4-diacetamido-2,4,6-trideoxy-beta-L-altropyranose hydrolase [Deltaproteobacteria bacterium]|nr:UDP-2,4-diacetamido-2,4,6-trideoxy-beta-L-altropyranose hydrolase [Deltaproteobacteria bacterium]
MKTLQHPVVAIIQARMGSSRLPGKVLLPVAGRSLLEHLVERLQRCETLDQVVVATTVEPGDDAVAAEAERLGIQCFRGSVDDVLGRFDLAVQATGAATIVRVTGDCPLMAPAEVDRVVCGAAEQQADYAANQMPGKMKLPLGYAVEVVRRAAFDRAVREATARYAREHVMPYLYEEPGRFVTAWIEPAVSAPDLRVTVDTPADFAVVKAVLEALDGQPAAQTVAGVVAWLREHPEVAALNQDVGQKSFREAAGTCLLLRADGGPQVGLGHILRLAGLGQAWRKRGGRARLLCGFLTPALLQRLTAMGLEVLELPSGIAPGSPEDLAWVLQQTVENSAPAVLVDGYCFAPAWLHELRRRGPKVAYVDDFGDASLQLDLVLMPNVGAQVSAGAQSPVLAGAQFTPVRAEFQGLPAKQPPSPDGRRLLLTFGGADPARMSERALAAALQVRQRPEVTYKVAIDLVLGAAVPAERQAALAELAQGQADVRILRDVADMPALMAQADLAVAAAGTTCWELAAVGVPMLVVQVADNQAVVVRGIVGAGAATALPPGEELGGHFLQLILLEDSAWRARSQAGQRLIDGQAATRIAQALAELVSGTGK